MRTASVDYPACDNRNCRRTKRVLLFPPHAESPGGGMGGSARIRPNGGIRNGYVPNVYVIVLSSDAMTRCQDCSGVYSPNVTEIVCSLPSR